MTNLFWDCSCVLQFFRQLEAEVQDRFARIVAGCFDAWLHEPYLEHHSSSVSKVSRLLPGTRAFRHAVIFRCRLGILV